MNSGKIIVWFLFRIRFSIPKHEKKEIWKNYEVTRKVPTDNSKSVESECKLVCWFKKNPYSFRWSRITKMSSPSHKIQSHKRNVTSLTKMSKRNELLASQGGELSFSRNKKRNQNFHLVWKILQYEQNFNMGGAPISKTKNGEVIHKLPPPWKCALTPPFIAKNLGLGHYKL